MTDWLKTLDTVVRFVGPDQDLARALPTGYDPYLVGLSVAIAVFAAYAAFTLAMQMRASARRWERLTLLIFGALALGGGTWTMHFLGMLAWQLATPVNYDIAITVLSAVPAIASGAISLYVIGYLSDGRISDSLVGGVLMGAGIGVMHYSGMAALRMEALVFYDPFMFGVSVLVAIVFSAGSLHLATKTINKFPGHKIHGGIIGAAALMGVAISIMHYTGMAASFCFAAPNLEVKGVNVQRLALIVGFAALFILTLAIIASQVARRLRVIPILEHEIAKRQQVEAELRVNREALSKSHEELEERVRQRTQELEQEIVERKRMEMELVHAMRDAEKANKMKSAFLSHMSHEFRTPLNGILGYLELLSSDVCRTYDHDKIQSIVAEIHKAGTHLSTLINDVLDISRIEAGMEDVNEEEVEVAPAVRKCLDLVNVVAGKKDIGIHVAEYTSPVRVICDSKHFKQILINILSNAINYTPVGGHVHIGMEAGGDGFATITVRDTGVGIRQNDIERVFREFERSENAMVSTGSGTGLGLPLTKRLVEMNGGTIELDSEVGVGTTVTIRCRLAEGGTVAAEGAERRQVSG
ncbi:MAG: MHYT domain-containing protein [Rhodospirillales bacterium]